MVFFVLDFAIHNRFQSGTFSLTLEDYWNRLRGMGLLPAVVYAALAGVAGYTNPIQQQQQTVCTDMPKNHLRGVFQNDSISGEDSNFSHGTRIDYTREVSEKHAWALTLTQNMYTPEEHTFGNVSEQHPYCGYLALGGGYLYRGAKFGCGTEMQVGTTGKASLAGKTQNAVHDLLGMEKWRGWDDQVKSEVTVQLTSRQEWLVKERTLRHGWESEARVYIRESLGTFNISGGAGILYRLGYNLPPSMTTNEIDTGNFSVSLLRKPGYDRNKISYFLLAGVYSEYVARDMTIDGGVFHHFDRTCGRTPWQVQGQLGVGVSCRGIDYYVGMLLHSRSYRTQDKNSLMGVFALTWNW